MRAAKIWLFRLVFVFGFATIVYFISHLPYWACVGISLVSLVINGAVIEIEDNQPGGWSNPEGLSPAPGALSGREIVLSVVRIAFFLILTIYVVYLVTTWIPKLWGAE